MKLLVILLTLLILSGCAGLGSGACRYQALYTGAIAKEKYPVKVHLGRGSDYNSKGHAQTKAEIDGKWEFLCMVGTEPVKCPKDKLFRGLIESDMEFAEYVEYLSNKYRWARRGK